MLRRIAPLSVALLALLPAAAQAAPFPDRVLPGPQTSRLQATAAQATTPAGVDVPTREGSAVHVDFSPAVGSQPAIAQAYVAFLDGLPHGSELGRLRILVVDPSEVSRRCGGGEQSGIIACYSPSDQQMTVPSVGLGATNGDGQYTTEYVLTHEYGHHIAANRRNALLQTGAIDLGPKYWASYELVCDRVLGGRLFPAYEGDDVDRYHANPGEGWAEAYARLAYPEQPWTFSSLLAPDAGALDAARRDVVAPWSANVTKRFTMAAGRNRQAFQVPLTLDGRLSASISGPRGSEVSVRVTSGAQKVGVSKRTGARDRWSLASGCRERPTETLTFTATRSGGRPGPVTLTVSYAG